MQPFRLILPWQADLLVERFFAFASRRIRFFLIPRRRLDLARVGGLFFRSNGFGGRDPVGTLIAFGSLDDPSGGAIRKSGRGKTECRRHGQKGQCKRSGHMKISWFLSVRIMENFC